MLSKIIVLALLLLGAFFVYKHFNAPTYITQSAQRVASSEGPYKEANDVICPTKEECSIINECKCWCSHKCGPRSKVKDDKPVFIMSDPNGNYCYCNQWDLDNYDRCKIKDGNGQVAPAPVILNEK